MRYGMVIDLERCIGCDACAMACSESNGTPQGVYWANVLHEEVGEYPNARIEYTPLLCMHCENPPCVHNCPTGASMQAENGIVTVNAEECIGCKQCVLSCPYRARWYLSEDAATYYPEKGRTPKEVVDAESLIKGTVTKCVFCKDRIAEGERPMCVRSCPASARTFGDLDDPESEVSALIRDRGGFQLAPEFGTNPSVFYLE